MARGTAAGSAGPGPGGGRSGGRGSSAGRGPGRGSRGGVAAGNGGGGRRTSVNTELLDPVERARLRYEQAKAKAAAAKKASAAKPIRPPKIGNAKKVKSKIKLPVIPGPHKKKKESGGGGHASAPAASRGSGPHGGRGSRGGGRGGGNGGGAGGSGGGSGGCFVEGTAIQMADGTTKEITTIQIGEETKGGTVQAKMEFMPQNIYEYKGVLVSGSHWVVEDNQFIEVQDSKHGVLTDRVEPVHTFKTSENRIWIHGIEFGDFETGSDEDWAPYFEEVKQKLNKELLVNSENI